MPLYLTESGTSPWQAGPARPHGHALSAAGLLDRLRNSRSEPRTTAHHAAGNADSTFNTGIVKLSGKRLPQYKGLQRWFRGNRSRVKRPGSAFSLPLAPPEPTIGG